MNSINVEVVYARSDKQFIITTTVDAPCSIEQAILKSGVLELCEEINLKVFKVGIFSKQAPLDHLVKNNDRIEIYRPLQIDPKQARRLRAKK